MRTSTAPRDQMLLDRMLLVQLADPQIEPRELDVAGFDRLPQLVEAARRHDVHHIVMRNLRSAGLADRIDPGDQSFRDHEAELLAAAGLSLLLDHHRKRIMDLFEEAGVPAAVVKGPVFAGKLYRHQSDRQFTDIDILVDPLAMDRACQIVGGCGFKPLRKDRFDNSERYQEFKWLLDDAQAVLVELHANLVHYPALRRRVSFGYRELIQAGGGEPESPVALLMVAVIHATCGHKFHNLSLLVDVLQAARRIPPDQISTLVSVSRAMGAELEAIMALSIAGDLFDDRAVVNLASCFRGRLAAGTGKRLVTPKVVLDAGSPSRFQSKLRRNAFRWLQISPFARL